MTTVAPIELQPELDAQDYPVEEKFGQGKKHEKRFTELLSFLRVLLDAEPNAIVGGDRFIYYEKGNRKKSVAPDAFKLWETPIDLRFAREIWSAQNDEAERHRKLALYRDILKAKEYAELAFVDGLIRIYKDGKKIPTLKEALNLRQA